MGKKRKGKKGRANKAVQPRALPSVRRIPAGPEIDPFRGWYIALTKPGQDRIAAQELADAGYVVFRPCYARIIKLKHRKYEAVRSLFPGYVLVSPSEASPASIHGLDGVRGLITANDRPCHVPALSVLEIIAYLSEKQEPEFCRPKIGDFIDVVSGPFEGLSGIVTGEPKGDLIPVEINGRKVGIPLASTQQISHGSCAA